METNNNLEELKKLYAEILNKLRSIREELFDINNQLISTTND